MSRISHFQILLFLCYKIIIHVLIIFYVQLNYVIITEARGEINVMPVFANGFLEIKTCFVLRAERKL